MKLIEILPNVYGVKVPKKEVKYIKVKLDFNGNYMLESVDDTFKLKVPFDFKILGTLTKDEISFDASGIVEKVDKLFKNYKASLNFVNAELSFRSALPEEVYFENPFEKPFYSDLMFMYFNYKQKTEYQEKLNIWQTAQENITQKLLILERL